MEATLHSPRVKICCISSPEEAALAVRLGASALGLVSSMPSGPGVIEEAEIARIAATVPPGVSRFLLTCAQDAETILRQQRETSVDTLQLCDSVPIAVYLQLRRELPGIRLVQVIHVESEANVAEAESVAPYVDAILLDSGRPSLPVKELGGTGRVHDWTLSSRIREAVPVPLFLAGGLTPDNVGDAIRQVRPYGLDLCSSVRVNGSLDEGRLSLFMAAVRAA